MVIGNKSGQDRSSGVRRRQVIQALGAATAVNLAGCSESGDGKSTGESGDVGERVPTQVLGYTTGLGSSTAVYETMVQVIQSNLAERLGVEVEVEGREIAAIQKALQTDQREFNMVVGGRLPSPSRLDPTGILSAYEIQNAGRESRGNLVNYANCAYTRASMRQRQTADLDKRRELVYDALEAWSEDAGEIPLCPQYITGAWYPDQVTVSGHDNGAGMNQTNPYLYYESTPVDGDTIVSNVQTIAVRTTNFPTLASPEPITIWGHLINSPLVEYDDSLELTNVLAEDYTASEDGTTITVTLRDDATFHNGDPVTAEDVRFTFKLLWDNADAYPYVTAMPYDSIEVVDETTVEFTMSQTTPVLVTKVWPRWGILHRESWEPAMENPSEFSLDTDDIIGSGPFEVDVFEQGQTIQLSPYGDHPVHQPDTRHVLQVFQGSQSLFRSFQSGDVDMIVRQNMDVVNRLDDDDAVETHSQASFLGYQIWPQHNYGATKFLEFRRAVGAAVDRQRIIAQALYGVAEPQFYSSFFHSAHPYRPPTDRLYKHTDDPVGDEERARQTLAEAGWDWDDNGRLHYPVDADLTPLWPEGESPSGENYPCLSNNN